MGYGTTEPQCSSALLATCGRAKFFHMFCPRCISKHKDALQKAGCTESHMNDFCQSGWWNRKCYSDDPEWQCWQKNLPRKTGGWWYSTLAEGQCSSDSEVGSCGWKALSLHTVRNSCLKEKVMMAVENTSRSCFGGCGPRNITSTCYIGCFMDAILGPQARKSSSSALGGMPMTDIVKAWDSAFLAESEGGCPAVPSDAKGRFYEQM